MARFPSESSIGWTASSARVSSGIRVDAVTGIITTIAGNGTAGYSGDGGPATGTLTVVDGDTNESGFVAQTVTGDFGSLTIDAAGTWRYVADNSQALVQELGAGESNLDLLVVTTLDGTETGITITINGADDAALASILSRIWLGRADRYSELRPTEVPLKRAAKKVEMYRVGG